MKKVCMVVWNTFETDARVTKEAKSLADAGYDVTVIAVWEPGRTKRYEEKSGFKIKRINRLPFELDRVKNTVNYNKGEFKASDLSGEHQGAGRSLTETAKELTRTFLKTLWKHSKFFIMSFQFFRYAFKEAADIYHSHDLNTLLPVYLAAKSKKSKLVYDAHEISTDRAGWKNKRIWELLERKLIARTNAMITTNDTRGRFFVEKYGNRPPTIIRNYPEFQKIETGTILSDTLGISPERKIVLYQGGIQRDRGLEKVIEAVTLCLDLPIDIVFLGNGPLKPRLIQQVQQMGLHGRVHFLDAVPPEELLKYTACAYIGLQVLQNTCFNHYSACSNKIHEYLMAGVPVISNDLPEMRKVIKDTKAGLIINAHEVEEIANAIRLLITDEGFYNRCKENAISNGPKYNWSGEKEKLIEMYADVG